jgi:hypothetical protein
MPLKRRDSLQPALQLGTVVTQRQLHQPQSARSARKGKQWFIHFPHIRQRTSIKAAKVRACYAGTVLCCSDFSKFRRPLWPSAVLPSAALQTVTNFLIERALEFDHFRSHLSSAVPNAAEAHALGANPSGQVKPHPCQTIHMQRWRQIVWAGKKKMKH